MECKYIEGMQPSIEFIHMKRSFKKTAAGMFVVDGVDFFVHMYLVENVFFVHMYLVENV